MKSLRKFLINKILKIFLLKLKLYKKYIWIQNTIQLILIIKKCYFY